MRSLLPAVFSVVTALLSQGCASVSGKHYVTPTVAFSTGDHRLLDAAERNAQDRGWAVIRHDEHEGVVEAIAPVVVMEGAQTREHWFFRAHQGSLAAQRVFEVRWDPSAAWESSEVVCDGYEYAREQQEIVAISRVLGVEIAAEDSLPTRGHSVLTAFE